MRPSRVILFFVFLLSAAFALGTFLQPRAARWGGGGHSEGPLSLLVGDSRRLFATHFYIKADVSFHSGFYPSIFDQGRQAEEEENHIAAEQHGETGEDHEDKFGFLGSPKDWIDRFGRHFRVTEHTHLKGGNVREILPWLAISADLDPHRVETYTVASYWLRQSLGKVDEAEAFLRRGLRENPGSYEILFELGRLYHENRHSPVQARNLWKLALVRWDQAERSRETPDWGAYDAITVDLAHLEEQEGHDSEAIKWFELTKAHSPAPDELQKQIDVLKSKLAARAR